MEGGVWAESYELLSDETTKENATLVDTNLDKKKIMVCWRGEEGERGGGR